MFVCPGITRAVEPFSRAFAADLQLFCQPGRAAARSPRGALIDVVECIVQPLRECGPRAISVCNHPLQTTPASGNDQLLTFVNYRL